MKNLEQIRARNALRCQQETHGTVDGKNVGDIIKNIPTLVMNHGLLGTAANAYEKNNAGMRIVLITLPDIWLTMILKSLNHPLLISKR